MNTETHEVPRITDKTQCIPGKLYVACLIAECNGEPDFIGNLYWFGSDNNFYADGGFLGSDNIEPSYPDWDYLIEQTHAFDASYAA